MNLLVTGGLGFIGSNFIRHILSKYPDYKIINLDSVAYCANFDNVKDFEKNPRYGFVKGDIADKERRSIHVEPVPSTDGRQPPRSLKRASRLSMSSHPWNRVLRQDSLAGPGSVRQ